MAADVTVNKTTLHIIGVGGTGAKLINASVHLVASGVFGNVLGNTTKIDKIRVVAIDADTSNGSRRESGKVVDHYGDFYQAVVEGANNPLGLVPIIKFKDIDLFKAGKESIKNAFKLPEVNLAGMSGTDRFSRFLFTEPDIEMTFDEGFVGLPSVGTLIVNDVLENDPGWRKFCEGDSNTADTGLREGNNLVVVMGSLFGGTGASAIPVLLQKLAQIRREVNASLKYAVLMCTPYFLTKGKDDKAPDARTFSPKARSALHYYHGQYYNNPNADEKPDAVYIIGEPEDNFSMEDKHGGGKDQENKPHVMEFFAASALVDFARDSDSYNGAAIIRTAKREKVHIRIKGNEQKTAFGNTWKMVGGIDPKLPDDLKCFMKICLFYNKVLFHEFGKEGDNHRVKSAGTWPFKYKAALLEKKGVEPLYKLIHSYTEDFVQWFFAIHKKIKDPNEKVDWKKNWEPDTRVRLFFTGDGDPIETKKLYTGAGSGDAIPHFESLVFDGKGDKGKKSEEIYADLCREKPEKGKGFVALFGTLRAAILESAGVVISEETNESWIDYLPVLSSAHINAKADSLWTKSKTTALRGILEEFLAGSSDNGNGVSGSSGNGNGVSGSSNNGNGVSGVRDIQIPSPWSIFITQELALTNPAFGALHTSVYKQWAGIIALLALRTLCRWDSEEGGPLELRDLRTDVASDQVASDQVASDQFVEKVVETLTPRNKIFRAADWKENYALLLDIGNGRKETLALLAHNTLVCPAYSVSTQAWKKLREIAPGLVDMEKNEFRPPENYFKET
ncbi:MAG: hypothetical protein LBH18_04785, partial [Spirochaetaceae bacterium]|nr:hypothetical protein [Spirochaetaceae bacterium]